MITQPGDVDQTVRFENSPGLLTVRVTHGQLQLMHRRSYPNRAHREPSVAFDERVLGGHTPPVAPRRSGARSTWPPACLRESPSTVGMNDQTPSPVDRRAQTRTPSKR